MIQQIVTPDATDHTLLTPALLLEALQDPHGKKIHFFLRISKLM